MTAEQTDPLPNRGGWKNPAKFLMNLRRIQEALGSGRRVVRIGNTFGVTFPPILVHPGQKVDIRPLSPNKCILMFVK